MKKLIIAPVVLSGLLLSCSIFSQAPASTSPNAASNASASEIKLLGYNYNFKDAGDGWNEGKIYIVLENISNEFVGGAEFNLANATVETLEGKTYPATLYREYIGIYSSAAGPADPPIVSFKGFPKVIPPHFRWNRVNMNPPGLAMGDYYLKFRFATAAHPLRITFPSHPGYTIALDSSAKLSPVFPADESILASAKSISMLTGKSLADDPAGLRITLDGTGASHYKGDMGLYLEYSITNNDKLDSHQLKIPSPFLAYFDEHGFINTSFQNKPGTAGETLSFEAGPGQTREDAIKLLYTSDVSFDCNPNVYAVSQTGSQYTLYNLNICK